MKKSFFSALVDVTWRYAPWRHGFLWGVFWSCLYIFAGLWLLGCAAEEQPMPAGPWVVHAVYAQEKAGTQDARCWVDLQRWVGSPDILTYSTLGVPCDKLPQIGEEMPDVAH